MSSTKKEKYNEEIISTLITFGIGTREDIINAMNNVVNKNDINEISEYIMNNTEKKLNDDDIDNDDDDYKSNKNNNNDESKREYNEGIIVELMMLGVGTRDDIINGMDNVSNRNDRDEIADYIISNQPQQSYNV